MENKTFYMKCPVCGEQVEYFDVCDNCDWQNSGPKEDEYSTTGPNKMLLADAKEAYKKGLKIE